MVEPCGEALRNTTAYIDLNAVRAGIVDDPKDYRWCGYAEAAAGRAEGLAGIVSIVGMATNSPDSEPISSSEAMERYREWLAELGAPVVDENGEVVRRGFAEANAEGNAEGKGDTKLSQAAQLGTRVRYLTASCGETGISSPQRTSGAQRGNIPSAPICEIRGLQSPASPDGRCARIAHPPHPCDSVSSVFHPCPKTNQHPRPLPRSGLGRA